MKEVILYLLGRITFFGVATVAIFNLFCYVLYRLDRAPDSTFKFSDFFTAGELPGKASVGKLAFFGAFLVHSEVVLFNFDKAAVELYALIWSGAYAALKLIDRKGAAGEPETRKDS